MTGWPWLVATIVVFEIFRWAYAWRPRLYTLPILGSMLVLGGAVLLLGASFDDYAAGTWPLTWLLGPTTVALALPLYRQRAVLARHARAVLAGVAGGALAALVTAVLLARAMNLSSVFVRSVAPKGVTTPVALSVSEHIGGSLEITAAAVVGTGLLGIAVGPAILSLAGVRSRLARGIGLGTGAHAMGTAAALGESTTSGAASAVAMVLAAVLTALLAGPLVDLLG